MHKEIFHSQNLNLHGKKYYREAVRSVIIKESEILLIYSPINGDYKFPGGGIEEFETHELALKREILEECGLTIKLINTLLGKISEFDKPKENNLDYFQMDSFYYHCELLSFDFLEQKLDKYEEELNFTPVWINIHEAIKVNKNILESGKDFPTWTRRDTFFLEYLTKQPYINSKL